MMLVLYAAIGLSQLQQRASNTLRPSPGHPLLMPTEYLSDWFIAKPVSNTGRRLRLFTDSAGGYFIYSDVAHSLELPAVGVGEVRNPTFRRDSFIPLSKVATLNVFDRKQAEQSDMFMPGYDGLLGSLWFTGRVWTLDYPRRQLYWRAPSDVPTHSPTHEVKLYFKSPDSRKRPGTIARLVARVGGERLSFSLDTGAGNDLSAKQLKAIGDHGPSFRATSLIGESTYRRWKKRHPEWRVISASSQDDRTMIEVPDLVLGGYRVKAWFTVVPDTNFTKYMSQWMDRPAQGAIGGSALRTLRVTLDWPNAIAVFEKPSL